MNRITRLLYEAEKLARINTTDLSVIVIIWDDEEKKFIVPEITYRNELTYEESVEPSRKYSTPEEALEYVQELIEKKELEEVHVIINDTMYLREEGIE